MDGLKRVVVTGIGLVTPLGTGVKPTWDRLVAGESGARVCDRFDITDIAAKVACQVPRGNESDAPFNPDEWMDPKEVRRVDEFIQYGVAAAEQALKDANWAPEDEEEKERTGVLIGSGIGGLPGIEDAALVLRDKGARRISPFFIPGRLINLVSGHVSINHGFTGPNHAVVTACSTGAHAIGDAARLIMLGDADVMVAGGTEGAICAVGMAGFASARAMSTNFNDRPTEASRPWDKDRDGFVMGEGAGIVVLESLDHAQKRGAKIYAELIGYGLTGDAYHITAPHPEGSGAYRCMRNALRRAGINTDKVGYINAHGTSTPLGDELELKAMKRLFGADIQHVSVSSTKSSIGHLLGAAGGVEAIFSILALQNNLLPPTLNLQNPSEGCVDVDLVPLKAKEKKLDVVMSNSFGFGGTNACLVFGRMN